MGIELKPQPPELDLKVFPLSVDWVAPDEPITGQLRVELLNHTERPLERCRVGLVKLSRWNEDETRFEWGPEPCEAMICTNATVPPKALTNRRYRFV